MEFLISSKSIQRARLRRKGNINKRGGERKRKEKQKKEKNKKEKKKNESGIEEWKFKLAFINLTKQTILSCVYET